MQLAQLIQARGLQDVQVRFRDLSHDRRAQRQAVAWAVADYAQWHKPDDVRDDAVINVLDLWAVKSNWRSTAPGPWPGSVAAAQASQPQRTVPPIAPQAAAQATVVVSPSVITTSIGAPARVEIWVQDVESLYGGGFELDFDASVVRVQDANPFADGVQIEAGNWLGWLERQLDVANTVYTAAGEIDFFVTQSYPATWKDGSGILARITFVGTANGNSTLEFTSVQLVDDEENNVPAAAQDGEVVVGVGEPAVITASAAEAPLRISEAMRYTAAVTGTELHSRDWDFGGAVSRTGLDCPPEVDLHGVGRLHHQ
jgi:hypothetical protein